MCFRLNTVSFYDILVGGVEAGNEGFCGGSVIGRDLQFTDRHQRTSLKHIKAQRLSFFKIIFVMCTDLQRILCEI